MEKKKLNLKKEVVTTLTNENLRGGYDPSYYTTDPFPTMKGGCETGRCVVYTREDCYYTAKQCPETEVCVVPLTDSCESVGCAITTDCVVIGPGKF